MAKTKDSLPAGYYRDSRGNVRTPIETEIRNGELHISYRYVLEPGTSTLRGQYPKLAQPPRCVNPDRLDCNSGEGYARCKFMKYDESASNWKCTA
jgi:hypothetical protein